MAAAGGLVQNASLLLAEPGRPGSLGSMGAVGKRGEMSNPLRPRAFGGKGAEGLKKEIPSNSNKIGGFRAISSVACLSLKLQKNEFVNPLRDYVDPRVRTTSSISLEHWKARRRREGRPRQIKTLNCPPLKLCAGSAGPMPGS